MYRELIKQLVTDTASVRSHEKYWREEVGYLDVLSRVYPQGVREGEFYRLAAEGDAGRRLAFNINTGKWTDFADEEAGNHGPNDTGNKGLVSFVWYVDRWEGLIHLAQTEELPFDWVIYNGMKPDERPIYQFADKKGLMVAKKWVYEDVDGEYLGTRVRLEHKSGEKEFRLLSYRTRKVTHDAGGKRRVQDEGWRLDGEWGAVHPIYNIKEIIDKPHLPVLLVEGEKSSDAATELLAGDYVCATWGGGASIKANRAAWGMIPKDRDIYYWPDKDEPGKKTIPKLVDFFPSLKMVDVWALPDLSKNDDLADVKLMESGALYAFEALKKAIYASALISSAPTSNQYVYVTKTEEFVHLETGHRLAPKALARAHQHQVESLDEELLSDPRTQKVYSLTYWPGQPRIVTEMDERGNMVEKINLWREGGCESMSGDAPSFLSHMEHLIPDAKVREHFFDYFAFMIQHPGEKIHYAILLMGPQGVGKSYLVEVLRELLGRINVREIDNEQLNNQFNPWMADAQILAIEEVMAGGRREVTNKLKPMITSRTVQINDKNVKLYEIPNRVNMILFSNFEDPLALDDDDRRFLVYKTPLEKQSESYYTSLFDSIGMEAPQIKNFLATRDLTNFNAKGRAPMTEDKKKLIAASESGTLSTLRMYVESRRTPFDQNTVSVLDVADWIRANLRSAGRYESSPKAVRSMLEKLGAKHIGNVDNAGEVGEMWSLREHSLYHGDLTVEFEEPQRD
jgi:hypothetical protein